MNFRTLCWLKRYWWKIRSIEKWKRRRHPIHTILQPPVHRDLRALQPTELSNAHKRFIHHLDSEAIQAAVTELLKNRPDTLPSASKLFNNQQIIQQYWKTIDDRFLPSINCFNFLYYVVFPRSRTSKWNDLRSSDSSWQLYKKAPLRLEASFLWNQPLTIWNSRKFARKLLHVWWMALLLNRTLREQ